MVKICQFFIHLKLYMMCKKLCSKKRNQSQPTKFNFLISFFNDSIFFLFLINSIITTERRDLIHLNTNIFIRNTMKCQLIFKTFEFFDSM